VEGLVWKTKLYGGAETGNLGDISYRVVKFEGSKPEERAGEGREGGKSCQDQSKGSFPALLRID